VQRTISRTSIAAFERSLLLDDTRLDRWLNGDKEAMSYEAIRGLLVFTSEKARCFSCHSGPNLTRATANNSESFIRLGVKPVEGDKLDFGKASAPGEPPRMEQLFARTGAFRIPSLRGVRDTAPYMHNGGLPTLESVIDFYDRGGDEGLLPQLALTADEKRFLLSFLREGLSR
jgi:cytochrome c peroxidase